MIHVGESDTVTPSEQREAMMILCHAPWSIFFSSSLFQKIILIIRGCLAHVLFGKSLRVRAVFELLRLQNNQKLVCFVLSSSQNGYAPFFFFFGVLFDPHPARANDAELLVAFVS